MIFLLINFLLLIQNSRQTPDLGFNLRRMREKELQSQRHKLMAANNINNKIGGKIFYPYSATEVNNVIDSSENNGSKPGSSSNFKNGETKLLSDLLDGYDPNARPVLNYNEPVQEIGRAHV